MNNRSKPIPGLLTATALVISVMNLLLPRGDKVDAKMSSRDWAGDLVYTPKEHAICGTLRDSIKQARKDGVALPTSLVKLDIFKVESARRGDFKPFKTAVTNVCEYDHDSTRK